MSKKHSVKSRIILFIVLNLIKRKESLEIKYDKEWDYIVNKKDDILSSPLLRNKF